MKERFLTLQEISNYTHTSVPFLKKLIDNGMIKAIRISKNYVVSEYEYLKFIEQMTDKDLLKMLGLYDRTITLTLEDEILDTMNKFHQDNVEHEKKKKEFLSLFKECYDDIVKIIEFDPHKRIAVDCFTCVRGMDLSKQYGKPKKK